ncbi:MAG: hypothetical protein V1898_00770 [Patescibacteria group bacterium]
MARSKPILGLIEEVKLYLPNKKFIRLKAKVDTGAHFTALDISLAKKLNLLPSLRAFHKHCPKFKITIKNFKDIKRKIKSDYLKTLKTKCPGLVDVKLIPATNGFSVRPFFKIELSLKGKRIKTMASLVDRSHMGYIVLLGKSDMAGFLIDPTKNIYNNL